MDPDSPTPKSRAARSWNATEAKPAPRGELINTNCVIDLIQQLPVLLSLTKDHFHGEFVFV